MFGLESIGMYKTLSDYSINVISHERSIKRYFCICEISPKAPLLQAMKWRRVE